jgi:ATP-dependent transcriptional regulator
MPHLVLADLRRTVDDALAAGDVDSALDAVRPQARALAAEVGADFRELISRIPETAWQHDAGIASAMGASYRAAGSPSGSSAIGYFHAAEAALAEAPRSADPDRVAVWLGHAAALRSLGRLDAAARYVQRTRDLDGPGSVLSVPVRVELGARSTLESGLIDLHLGNVDAARRQLEFAHGLAPENLTRAERIECLGGLAILEYFQAHLETGAADARAARELAAGTDLLASGYGAAALLAETLLALDRGDLDAAAATEAELLAAAHRADWQPFAFVVAGMRRFRLGLPAEALDFLQRARQGFRSWSPAGLGLGGEELIRAWILITLDQGAEAWEILRRLDPFEHHVLCPARLVALLRLGHGDLRGATAALRDCEELGDDHAPRTMIDVRILRAAIELARGESGLADVMFDRAVATVARTGARSSLGMIPRGTLARLAERSLERPHSEDVRALLRDVLATADGADGEVEALSHRELLVLAEVEKGSTVAGIAAALYISPNTVKTHLRRLYRKLGVDTRADAIRKARSLGLGPPVTRDSPD